MQRRQNRKDLAYIKKFFYPRVGDFEIYYNRTNKYFQTKVNSTVFSGDSEQAVETQARAHLDQITKLEWKPFIIIDKSDTGKVERETYYGCGALHQKHSFMLHFWRLELAVVKDPRKEEGTKRIERLHPEDKRDDEYWSESDEKEWTNGARARDHYEASEYVYLDYDPLIWDTLMRMVQAMTRQREALDKLLGSKNLEKTLLAHREKLPALPAPKRRRRA